MLPGQDYVDLHVAAHRAVAAILEQAGIVRMAPEEQVASGVSAHFLPHGLGHFIGTQVHDVGGLADANGHSLPPPERYPALRLTRRLEAGNVVTVEPRSEEHTSELQSRGHLVCRLLLEKKKHHHNRQRLTTSS